MHTTIQGVAYAYHHLSGDFDLAKMVGQTDQA